MINKITLFISRMERRSIDQSINIDGHMVIPVNIAFILRQGPDGDVAMVLFIYFKYWNKFPGCTYKDYL